MVGGTTSMASKPSRRRVPCASERRGETSSAALAAMNSRRFIRSSSLFEDDGTQSITSRLWPHPLRVQMLRVAQDGYGVINGPDDPEIRLPLFPQKRTQVGHRAMSGSCQQATSFDHLVGAGDEGRRKIEAEGFCRLHVNHQIILCRSLDLKIGRLLALENAIDITGRAPKLVDAIGPVENQPAAVDIVSVAIHGRKSVLGSQFNDEIAMRRHSGARRYDQASIP